MLASPQFDTYGSLRRFARHSEGIPELIGLEYLLSTTFFNICRTLDIFKLPGYIRSDALYAYMGASKSEDTDKRPGISAIAQMSPKEQADMYLKVVEASGIQLDPDTISRVTNTK